jgi:acyl dehydratase
MTSASTGQGTQPEAQFLENRCFSELAIGDSASLTRTVMQRDICLFAAVSGDVNPAHLDPAYAATHVFQKIVAHSMWGGALISCLLGTSLPGPGTIHLGQDLRFRRPLFVGDTITVTVTVIEKTSLSKVVRLACYGHNQHGENVIEGTAEVMVPLQKQRMQRLALPRVFVEGDAELQA